MPRLPSYRSAYILRFHPYPRVYQSLHESMKEIVDERPELTDVPQNYSPALADQIDVLPVINEDEEAAENLDAALHPAEQRGAGKRIKYRRLRITFLVIDLAFAVLRKLA